MMPARLLPPVSLSVFLTGLVALFGVAPAAAQKQEPPPGGEPKDFVLPTVETLELDNGLRAKLVPFGQIPKVQVRVTVRTGNLDEAPDQVWLADLLGYMLEEGAGERDAAALAEAFAAAGGELRIGVGADSTWLVSDALAESASEVIHLLGDVARRPTLPASELERRQGDLVRELAVSKTRPGSQANDAFWHALYGDHPYGRLLPEADQVRGYDAEQLQRFHADHFGARRTHVYVVGVFDAGAVKAAIEQAFGGWKPGSEPTIDVPTIDGPTIGGTKAQAAAGRRVEIVDRPGAAQSTLRLGLPVVDPSHPDYVKLQVMNALLGGSFASRITANLREDKGYTYSPSSSVSTRYRTAAWLQRADVTTEVTGPALDEIFAEIDRLRREAPSAEEVEAIQNYLSGAFVRTNSNPWGIAFLLHYTDFHGLDDYLTTYVQRVHAVTPEEVRQVAETYLDPDAMTLVVVGDEAKIGADVEKFRGAP